MHIKFKVINRYQTCHLEFPFTTVLTGQLEFPFMIVLIKYVHYVTTVT